MDKINTYYKVRHGGTVKDVDLSKRIVTGFFNSFNYIDSDGDVLLKGSAKKTIADKGPSSNAIAKIKHALNHDLTQLVGKIQVLEERTIGDITGIYFETKISDTTIGNDTLINYQEEVYDNHSIGFIYKDIEYIEKDSDNWDLFYNNIKNKEDVKDYFWIVKEINLFEGSTVAFGANSLTPFLGVKSKNKDAMIIAFNEKINKLEKSLKSGNQSDDMMKTFELQILQIKQMISEMFETFDHNTVKPLSKNIHNEGIVTDNLINNFKL